ncbi:LOW QUALITY PROTEIN: Nascent polypeptide-associated complex subunit alpha [Parasponia andersonii]|uniref:Nascent polypeptide-associated complex subunit alpha n=1 Tax=Parasponia andersonii TaxID=3476 RepID=A0A2P5DF57_PARAD|nr:LOW QUALITY PROTEIN: Nascent polypeptide-associated complex subunit alpha [Parasponia andersonii]
MLFDRKKIQQTQKQVINNKREVQRGNVLNPKKIFKQKIRLQRFRSNGSRRQNEPIYKLKELIFGRPRLQRWIIIDKHTQAAQQFRMADMSAVPAKPEEEEIDETGARDIDLVVAQSGVSRNKAVKAHDGDIFSAHHQIVNDPAICSNLTSTTCEDLNLTHLHHCSSKLSCPKKGIPSILVHLVGCCCACQETMVRREQATVCLNVNIVASVSKDRARRVHRNNRVWVCAALWTLLLQLSCIRRV